MTMTDEQHQQAFEIADEAMKQGIAALNGAKTPGDVFSALEKATALLGEADAELRMLGYSAEDIESVEREVAAQHAADTVLG